MIQLLHYPMQDTAIHNTDGKALSVYKLNFFNLIDPG
jgi:hypothetical protein